MSAECDRVDPEGDSGFINLFDLIGFFVGPQTSNPVDRYENQIIRLSMLLEKRSKMPWVPL